MSIFKNIRLAYLYITATKSTLFTAATNGDLKRVTELLKLSKINVNAKDKDGKTPLHYAAEYGHKEVLEFLIEKLIEKEETIDARDTGESTPLHYAARNGHKDVVKFLIKNKAEVNARDKNGLTPLHLAVLASHTNIVILLMENGADVNANTYMQTPLHFAAEKGHKDVVIEICKGRLISAYNEKAVSSVKDEWKKIMGVLRLYDYPHIDSLRGDVIENLKNEIALPLLARCAFTVCASLSKVVEDLPLAPEIVKKFKDKGMISVKSALTMKNTTSAIIELLEPPRQALNGVNVQLHDQQPQQQGV